MDSCHKCGGWHARPLVGESADCLRAQLAAETKRADDAERITAGCRDLIATLRTKLAEAEQARDEAVREVERLKEENKRLVDTICERNSEICELEHAAEIAALLQPKEVGDGK